MTIEKTKTDHSFAWLNATQFLGALNDNVFKLLVILCLIGLAGEQKATNIASLANAIFVVPYLLFLALAGRLADKYSKRNIIVISKIAELAVMSFAVAAFWLDSMLLVYAALFFMALQSTFFGPNKYGIIRALVPDDKLPGANGSLQAATFLAIIIGTALGPFLSQNVSGNYALATVGCVCISAIGIFTSVKIRKTRPYGRKSTASVLFLRDIIKTLWSIHRKKNLLKAVLASSGLWLVGALIYINMIPYGMEQFGLTKEFSGYLFVVAAFGVAVGALIAGGCCKFATALSMAPLAALGVALSCIWLGLINQSIILVCVAIFILGFCIGLYIVPIHAYIQLTSPQHRRGEILAASSFLTWVCILSASGLMLIASSLFGLSPAQRFILFGTCALIAAVIIFTRYFEFAMRFFSSVIIRTFYRLKVYGAQNIPADGGALIVCNHVSYVDAPLVEAAFSRTIRFIMDRDFYNIGFLKPICALVRTIPISSNDPPRRIVESIRQAKDALKAGQIVCIFAEGGMTRNGNMRQFKNGLEKIVAGTNCKIIPAYIGGMWQSTLSYYYGKPFAKLPKRMRRRVSVHFGEPLPDDSNAQQVRLKVQELSCDYYNSLKSPRRSLAYRFVKTARKYRRRRCISSDTGKKLSYGQTLTASVILANKIEELTTWHGLPARDGYDKIGIMLPPSVGAVITNIAVALLNKVPVNLNYTLTIEQINSAINQCQIKTVITSSKLLDKMPNLKAIPDQVLLEDIVRKITKADRIKGSLKARFTPAHILAKTKRHNADDLATIIFSSGSSGQPKGIMLSHHNILSNIDSMCSIFRLKPNDNLCAVLPFFHSFGFTCSLWLPIEKGVSASYVSNPLDGKLVGKTARENNSTVLFAAPTFLINYIRRTESEDFATLRFVLAGAEKLKTSIADSFEQKFGTRPREGYGATELSPAVAFNLEDIEINGHIYKGTKEGTIGHPIPGVAVKIVDLQTHQPLETGQQGLLMVKGPNVMLGYLDDQQKTEEVIKDGWYITGDIAAIDEDGFITITDRLSRFSKIGGEMVPHIALEEKLHDLLNLDGRDVAVTSIPDEKKGEQLIVLHTAQAGDSDKLYDVISNSDLPNIYKPKRDNYIRVDKIPALGSGKLDLLKLKQIAAQVKKSTQ
ncbi:MAG: MFS transporter [Sedimentisphaerales bacterium]|nr:MFS transporter [Sedimentisphaerales bacterium]